MRSKRVFVGVDGVQFQTDAVQGSKQETVLQDIQSELADGIVSIRSDQPVPHLYLADQVDGPPVIGLWVPVDKRRRAEELLVAAGYKVTRQA